MEVCRCQRCGEPTLVPGHLVVGEGSQIFRFAPAATHSYWDEAHATIPTWFDLKRARKLAFFGWNPKGKLDDDDSGMREHPMRDRLLDG